MTELETILIELGAVLFIKALILFFLALCFLLVSLVSFFLYRNEYPNQRYKKILKIGLILLLLAGISLFLSSVLCSNLKLK